MRRFLLRDFFRDLRRLLVRRLRRRRVLRRPPFTVDLSEANFFVEGLTLTKPTLAKEDFAVGGLTLAKPTLAKETFFVEGLTLTKLGRCGGIVGILYYILIKLKYRYLKFFIFI